MKDKQNNLLQIAHADALEALALLKECNDDFYYDPGVIGIIVNLLKESELAKAIIVVDEIQDEWTKQIALSRLAVHTVPFNLQMAIKIANSSDSHYKPRTLETITSIVTKNDVETAKQIAESIEYFPSKIGALASIASCTHDEDAVDELIFAAEAKQKFDIDDKKWEILSNIACSIADNFPERAIELLKDIQVNQSDAITVVALNLTDADVAIDLIKTSLDDTCLPELSFALGAMALKLAKTDRKKAMELIDEIQDEHEKERTLFMLTEK